jgi:sporulation protein YlmC with PRC-barrel domain
LKQIQHETTHNTALAKLSDTGLALADSSQDIRGRKVVDRNEDEIGHVSSLFIDEAEQKVRMIEIRAGGFFGIGERHFLLPVDAITSVDKHEVHINATREHIAGSPTYNPGLLEVPNRSSWEPYYGYYGLSPYWGSGYMYPSFPFEEPDRKNQSHLPRD